MRLLGIFVALEILFIGAADAVSADKNKSLDPSPPHVHELAEIDPPAPRPHPRVTFHQKPKSLLPDAVTHDWPSFLGPNRNAVANETRLLKTWPEDGPALVWEMRKGQSYSAPAIADDHLVFLHRMDDREIVECVDPESGLLYWSYDYATTYRDRYGYGNGPRASPVIGDGRVYTWGAQGTLHCFDLSSGQLIWRRNLLTEFHAEQGFFGVTATPLLDGDLLIINLGVPGGPCVAAFDQATGKLVWGAGNQWGASYATPIPGIVHGEKRIFVFTGGDSRPPTGGLLAVDPVSGRITLRFPWRSKSYESVNAATPVIIGNRVFVTASYQTGGALVDVLPKAGQKTVWTTEALSCHWNTPINHNGHLYGFDGRHQQDAALACLNVDTGQEIWRRMPTWQETLTSPRGQKRTVALGPFRGSLLLVDDHFLCLGELGHLLWLDLSPAGYQELARTRLFLAPESWTLPIISHGLLYVVQNRPDSSAGTSPRLLCYDLRASE